jgi:hypothetical protein
MSIYAPWDQRTYPFASPRVFGRERSQRVCLRPLEIIEPNILSKESPGFISGKLAIGKLILPLNVKCPFPETVFAHDLYSDSLLHKLVPFMSKNYIRRDRLSNRHRPLRWLSSS